MDVKTYIQGQIANAHSQIDTVVQDLTDEQFNWQPTGTINPISAILVHVLTGEDYYIQAVLQEKPLFWEVGNWGQKIGVQVPPQPGLGWDEFRTNKVLIEPVLAYKQVVRAATASCLAGLQVEDLNRHVNFAGNMLPTADVLISLVVHLSFHAGEIAAVKGMQGLKGLPY